MRNILRALALILLMAIPALAQNSTTVTVNVTDAGGQTWNNGTYFFDFVGANNSTWPGGALPIDVPATPGALNGSGSATQSVPSNATIQPQPNGWLLTVCPNPAVTTNSGCFNQNVTISGPTQTLTVTPPAIVITVPTVATQINPVVAYADAEISGGWVGFSYYNVTSAANRQCGAVSAGNCTTWQVAGGGLVSLTATSPVVITPSPTTTTGVISCPTCFTGTPVSSFTGDGVLITNSASTGAVTATLGTAGAHKWWGNNTGSTAAPGYESLTASDLPTIPSSKLTGVYQPVFNALDYGAVGDGSTANATAFASLATAVNGYTQHPTNAQGLTDLPVAYFPSGTYNYASGLNFTQSMIMKCDQGAVLNYTGSAHAVDWGPTNLTRNTYQTTYYEIGCTFTGGGSMTEGIFVNDGVLYPRIWDSRFANFGNATSTVWQIFFNGVSVGTDDPEVARNFFFINDNVARNGVKVNSGNGLITNQIRFHDNVMLCAQVPGTTNTNGTHACSTSATALFSDGYGSQIENNSIAWFQPDIQLGSNSKDTVIHNLITETNSSANTVTAPVISFGDSTGGNNVSAVIDGLRISDITGDVHNTDASTTSTLIGPTTSSALIANMELQRVHVVQQSATAPIVTMNNTAGQTGNTYQDVLSATALGTFVPTALINTAGTNILDPFKGMTAEGDAASQSTYGTACSGSATQNLNCYFRIQNHSGASTPTTRLVLDSGVDTQAYPNRGGFVQHTSGAGGGTKLGDWEGLPVQFLTGTVGNLGVAWQVNPVANGGHLVAGTDNSFDIGASGATRPRTIYVGTSIITPTITVNGVTDNPARTAYITSNYTNATTTMSNVTGLSFSVAANTNYKVRCDLDYQTSASTADVKLQWTGPASPTAVTYDMVSQVTGSTLSSSVATTFSTVLTEAGTPTTATNFPLTLTMTLINGANAGTIQLQAAATGVGTITIIPGACEAQQ